MRFPQPFFENFRQWWCVDLPVNGKRKRIRLAKGRDNETEARRHYHALMLRHGLADPLVTDRYTVAQACDAFLDWTEKHRSRSTYDQRKHYLQSFCDRHGSVAVIHLKPFHVTRWVEEHPWSPHTVRDVIGIIKGAFQWAEDEGYISRNPIRSIKRPHAEPRVRVITTDEHRRILADSRPDFRDFITALYETGARPGEVAAVTARDVDLGNHRWLLHQHKTARKTQRPRIIYLSPKMHILTRSLLDQHPEGPIFLTATGRQWTNNIIRLRFQRLRERLDLSDDVTAYTYRHTYATNALARGLSPAFVAELMGHRDTTMLDRVYGHLNQLTPLLIQAAAQAVPDSECA